jgi:penicillin amidase
LLSLLGLPRAVDPPSGVILNANNRLVGPDYPYLITARWPEGFRQMRLAELMAGAPMVTREASAEWQMDDLSTDARMLLALMLDIQTADPRTQQAIDLLSGWDHRMRADRPEPLIWQAWSRALVRAIAADELGSLFGRYWRDQPLFILRVLREDPAWCDRQDTEATESCTFIVEAALTEALTELTESQGEEMTEWRWGDVHAAAFEHRPLGFLPVLGKRFGAEIDTHGGDHTLNRGQTPGGASEAPYRHRHGAGLRVVIDMGDPEASLYQMAMGQNGNPFGPNFDDWMADWRDGRYVTLTGSAEDLRNEGARSLRLTP